MILSKQDKSVLRSTIFRHLDGIATAPTAFALAEAGVLDFLQKEKQADLGELTARFKANEGYLNVALRILCSQGWLSQTISDNGSKVQFSLTPVGSIAFQHAGAYKEAVAFIPYAANMQEYLLHGFDPKAFSFMKSLFKNYERDFGMVKSTDAAERQVQEQILMHIEGLIAGPLVVALGMNGLFSEYFSVAPFEVEEFTRHHDEVKAMVDFFTHIGWFTQNKGVYRFTPQGLFFARRATAYGVTVSYLPTFAQVPELLFGDPGILWKTPPGSPEIHVDRTMNVWGSGGAHTAYFKKVDEMVIDLFNKPIHEQPKGFLDMGCGNGAFIEHIFQVIYRQTSRGKILEDYPLFIVGADFNDAALAATRKTLNHAGVWAKVVKGDIGKPELLASELQERYDIFLGDLLNVRSFLDHNRIFERPATPDEGREGTSSGAFAFRGRHLPSYEVEQNLVEHLRKWMPFTERFGLLVIELHTIPPDLAAAHIGRTAVTAYDATHGYSDQYIVELPCFLKAAAAAGLFPDPAYQARYPDSDLATVSINLLRGR